MLKKVMEFKNVIAFVALIISMTILFGCSNEPEIIIDEIDIEDYLLDQPTIINTAGDIIIIIPDDFDTWKPGTYECVEWEIKEFKSEALEKLRLEKKLLKEDE